MSLALAAGCANREVAAVDPTPATEQLKDIPVSINRDIDILFVIDNSGSMREEQASLVANFNRFIDVLNNIEGGLPNVHLGVISTDVGAGPFNISQCNGNGDNGALQNAARGPTGCSTPTDSYIIDLGTADMMTRQTNYSGSLNEVFSCIAELGTDGCGFEQPLESMRRALNGTTNQGFLRPDAFLAVIFITDEDDCSVRDNGMFDTSQTMPTDPLGPLSSFRCFEFGVVCEPDDPRVPGVRQDCRPRDASQYMFEVDEYVNFLRSLKADPNQIIVAGIIGNPSPVVVGTNPENNNPRLDASCVSQSGEAAPAVRLKHFLDQFPARNTVTTICNDNLQDALVQIAETLRLVIGNPCIEGNIDVDGDASNGIQKECQVSDVQFPNEDREVQTVLKECSSATPDSSEFPCWRLETDMENCNTTDTQQALIVERGNVEPPVGTHVVARCLVR